MPGDRCTFMQGMGLGNRCFSLFSHEQTLPKWYVASMRLDDGAVNAPLLLFFSFRPEVIQNDHFTSIRVAGNHEKSLGKRWGNSHAHAAWSGPERGRSNCHVVGHFSPILKVFPIPVSLHDARGKGICESEEAGIARCKGRE